EAGEFGELGNETTKNTELVHELERGENGSGFAENRAEADVGVGRVLNAPRNERERFADERLEGEIGFDVELLAVAKGADESGGIALENVRFFGSEFAASLNKPIDADGFLVPI